MNELLKLFEELSEGGPCCLYQLEEIMRFASGGMVSGMPTMSFYNFPTRKSTCFCPPDKILSWTKNQQAYFMMLC